jgi:hypothetical protein
MAPPSRDYWLGFFRGAGDNVFDAIDAAIAVAASEHPAALRQRRDGIAERLYTAHLATGAPTPAQPHPEGAASVPSLCSSEAVTEDGAPRRDDGSALAEAERIKALLLNDQEQVRPPTSAAPFVRPPARPPGYSHATSTHQSSFFSPCSRRTRCWSCSGGCSSWTSRWTPWR